MSEYRNTADIFKARQGDIDIAAYAMCDALSLKDETHYEQARILALSMCVFAERDAATPSAWRAVGYIGNLLALHGKALRLMNSLFWGNQARADVRNEKPIDNAIDSIVYATFFTRCYIDGDSNGAPPTFRPPLRQFDDGSGELQYHKANTTKEA